MLPIFLIEILVWSCLVYVVPIKLTCLGEMCGPLPKWYKEQTRYWHCWWLLPVVRAVLDWGFARVFMLHVAFLVEAWIWAKSLPLERSLADKIWPTICGGRKVEIKTCFMPPNIIINLLMKDGCWKIFLHKKILEDFYWFGFFLIEH